MAAAKPIGKIQYFNSSGNVGEEIEFVTLEALLNTVHEDNGCGVPMHVVLYIPAPKGFLAECVPPVSFS